MNCEAIDSVRSDVTPERLSMICFVKLLNQLNIQSLDLRRMHKMRIWMFQFRKISRGYTRVWEKHPSPTYLHYDVSTDWTAPNNVH